jgi:hypothetical protein
MWPASYFGRRYWPTRLWAKIGAALPITSTPSRRTLIVRPETRALIVRPETRAVSVETLMEREIKTLHLRAGAQLDYAMKWREWLDGDTISSATWQVDPGLKVLSSSATGTTATVWLTCTSDVDARYKVRCSIQTVAGRRDNHFFYVEVD